MKPEVEEVYKNLKARGKKLTETRRVIIEMLCGAHNVLSAPEILNNLHKRGIYVNKTTVYRELLFLLQSKLVCEVNVVPGAVHYESALSHHHHHVVCTECGEIAEVVTKELGPSMRKLEARVASEGFMIEEHSLEFYGVCASCK